MCNNLKKRIATSLLCIFMVGKGICKKRALGSCKTHYSCFYCLSSLLSHGKKSVKPIVNATSLETQFDTF